MKLIDILEDSNFGLSGIRKNELNKFLQLGITETLSGMDALGLTKGWLFSISKRMTGSLIDNMFHIRNVVNGKEKYLHRKLMHYMAPIIQSGVKSVSFDHPELKDSLLNSEEFVRNFIDWVVENIEAFKQVINKGE